MNMHNSSYHYVVAGTCLIVCGIIIAVWPLVTSPLAMTRLAINKRKNEKK